MKRLMFCLFLFAFASTGCASGRISTSDGFLLPPGVVEAPKVFCTVIKEPDPLLLGGWRCNSTQQSESGKPYANSFECWLSKSGGKYALYFIRSASKSWGDRRYMGWRPWSINGNQMGDDNITISVEDGEVYYDWRGEVHVKMTRIDK